MRVKDGGARGGDIQNNPKQSVLIQCQSLQMIDLKKQIQLSGENSRPPLHEVTRTHLPDQLSSRAAMQRLCLTPSRLIFVRFHTAMSVIDSNAGHIVQMYT